MIKCSLTVLGRAGRENIWLSFMTHEPRCAHSLFHDLEPNIFRFGHLTESVNKFILISCVKTSRFCAKAHLVFHWCLNIESPFTMDVRHLP